jgi:serine acetyltransferase
MGRVTIGNYVFVGARAILLPGSRIGDSCVIGGGSIVRGHIPSNSVAAGAHARILKSTSEYIESCVLDGVATKRLSPVMKKKALREVDMTDFSDFR